MRKIFSQSKIFLFCCVSFIGGVALASFLPAKILHYDLLLFGVATGLITIIVLIRVNNISRHAYLSRVLFIFYLLAFFIFGIWRYSLTALDNGSDKIWSYNGQQSEFVGIVNKDPDVRAANQKLTISVDSITTASPAAHLPVDGNVLVTTNLYPKYDYGDVLKISCKLQAPESFEEFAYDRYLARYNVYSVCYFPKVTVIKQEWKLTITQKLYKHILSVKNNLQDSINYGLLEPESSLLNAILLGNRRGLSQDLLDNFSHVGISHIIAISGMHIAIISVIILNLLLSAGLSRKQSFLFSIFLLAAYIILVGMPASALRAGFMVFLAMFAVYLGRIGKLINSLLLAAVVLLLFNPRLLRDDIGFQLSFLALLGIIYANPIFADLFARFINEEKKFTRLKKNIIEIITVTLSAQVFTMPLIVYYFHQTSIVAPLINLLIVPLLPLIIVCGMLAALTSLIYFDLAWLFFAPVYFLLKYVIWLARAGANLPFAYIEIEYVWAGWMVLSYIILSLGVWRYNNSKLI